MKNTMRRLTVVLAVVATAGCGAAGPSAPGPARDAVTRTGPPTPAPTAPPAPTTPASPTTPELTLVEAAPARVCGILVRVRFVPPSVATGGPDQPFLVGEPAAATPPPDDQPAPTAVAPAIASTVVTVLGQRFAVVAVDLVGRRVRVRALC